MSTDEAFRVADHAAQFYPVVGHAADEFAPRVLTAEASRSGFVPGDDTVGPRRYNFESFVSLLPSLPTFDIHHHTTMPSDHLARSASPVHEAAELERQPSHASSSQTPFSATSSHQPRIAESVSGNSNSETLADDDRPTDVEQGMQEKERKVEVEAIEVDPFLVSECVVRSRDAIPMLTPTP